MTICVRPYTHDDLPRLQTALAGWIQAAGDCGYYHPGNIAHRIYEGFGGDHLPAELVQVWQDDATIIGFAYNFVFDAGFFVFTSPEYRGSAVELAMLRSAHAATLRQIKATNPEDLSVITDVVDCDQIRIELLTQLGFEQYRLWDYITERSLSDPIPEATVPKGFAIRPATMADYAQLATIRNNAFAGTWSPALYRDQVMHSPGYQPEHEIVVVAPDGRLAAFTVIRLDTVNKVGLFEPVGTHSDFRRIGLARAMMSFALAQMKRSGIERAMVEHTADNLPAFALYRSLGFRKKYETLGYKHIQ